MLAVGRDSAGALVQVAYAIAGGSLTGVTTSRGQVYPVRVRFSVLDSAGKAVASLDTTRFFLSRTPVPITEHLVGRAAGARAPGTCTSTAS